MILRFKKKFDNNNFSEIEKQLKKKVRIKSKESTFVAFKVYPILYYVLIGRLFTLVDEGKVFKYKEEIVYEVISYRYWVAVAVSFVISVINIGLIGGYILSSIILGLFVCLLVAVIVYIYMWYRHKKYSHFLFQKSVIVR